MSEEAPSHYRKLRSFVLREGRMTSAQTRALNDLPPLREWPAGPVVPFAVTGRHAPLSLEIGAGDGENVAALAAAHPDEDFIACEVHGPGIGHLLLRAEALGLNNLWVARRDVTEVLGALPMGALANAYLFFPDPWQKTRHNKRRLFQRPLLDQLEHALTRHGRLFAATDCEDYAVWMLHESASAPAWRNLAGEGLESPRLRRRIMTKFERRGLAAGRLIHDFVFARR